MMILSLIPSGLRRWISPASDRLSAHFFRRGVPLPRLNRPMRRIRPLSVVVPARSLDIDICEEISETP